LSPSGRVQKPFRIIGFQIAKVKFAICKLRKFPFNTGPRQFMDSSGAGDWPSGEKLIVNYLK